MISSGTHTPGVSVDDFGVPPRSALRYERPATALARYVAGYSVLDSEPIDPAGTTDWMLPREAKIWIVLDEKTVDIRLGNRWYRSLAGRSLLGPASRAMEITIRGGVSILIDLTPLGWRRLFRTPADTFADRLVPLETVMPSTAVTEPMHALLGSDRGPDVKEILDSFFLERLGPAYGDEDLIEKLGAAVVDNDVLDTAMVAARLGIGTRQLRTAARRHFGFPTNDPAAARPLLEGDVTVVGCDDAAR
jgi:hypothetical protein